MYAHASGFSWDEGLLVLAPIAVATACLLGAQFLHWSVIDRHSQEWATAGDFFFLLALGEGLSRCGHSSAGTTAHEGRHASISSVEW